MESTKKIRVDVRFFSLLREEFGSERVVELKEGASIMDLAELFGLSKRIGDGEVFVARNFESAGQKDRLEDGDEVAFFPPVSGG